MSRVEIRILDNDPTTTLRRTPKNHTEHDQLLFDVARAGDVIEVGEDMQRVYLEDGESAWEGRLNGNVFVLSFLNGVAKINGEELGEDGYQDDYVVVRLVE